MKYFRYSSWFMSKQNIEFRQNTDHLLENHSSYIYTIVIVILARYCKITLANIALPVKTQIFISNLISLNYHSVTYIFMYIFFPFIPWEYLSSSICDLNILLNMSEKHIIREFSPTITVIQSVNYVIRYISLLIRLLAV